VVLGGLTIDDLTSWSRALARLSGPLFLARASWHTSASPVFSFFLPSVVLSSVVCLDLGFESELFSFFDPVKLLRRRLFHHIEQRGPFRDTSCSYATSEDG
jgi:hypothetical protein